MALQAGQLFGNYRIVGLIGEGGFGEVYLAENPLIDRRVAVKVLHAALAQDAELVRRFLNEARAASAIRHPNIIEVLDAGGTPDGSPYILMEFLEGISLQKRLADAGRLDLPQVLDIACQAGSALAAAHAVGIVHRDLKPENLFVVPDSGAPGGERVKVLDFGIAKIKHGGPAGGTVRTQTGFIMGSPAYMSPEQCKDSADVDLRADIYSFATILYEMLAGRTPYVAATGTELLVMHLTETPRPLRALGANVPAHVEAAIMRALSRAREDRFDSVTAFLGGLRGDAGTSTAVVSQPSASEAPPPVIAASRVAPVERTAVLPTATTFSRTAGEIGKEGSDSSDEEQLATPPSRRWIFLAFGGAAVAGLALLLLVPARPTHDSARRGRPMAEPEKAAETAGRETPQLALPAVLPSKPDAGAIPSAHAEASPVRKPEHEAAVRALTPKRPHHEAPNTLSQRTPGDTKKKPDQGASVQAPKKPVGVAGF